MSTYISEDYYLFVLFLDVLPMATPLHLPSPVLFIFTQQEPSVASFLLG